MAIMIKALIWIQLMLLVSPDLTHILKENVTVPRTPKKYNEETENLTCNDILHLQYLIRENVTYIPRTLEEYNEEIKDLKCNHPMLKITYVLNPDSKKTSIGCFCEKPVPVKYCLEYNINKDAIIIQQKYDAPCHNLSITPCEVKYFSSESYELFECFEKYGGISSPIENQRNINSLMKKIQDLQEENDSLKSYKVIAIFLIVAFIPVIILLDFILFHVRNRKIKEKSLSPVNNSGAMPLMKSDEQKKENDDEVHSKPENTGVGIEQDLVQQPDDLVELGEDSEKDLPSINISKVKESVVWEKLS